MEPALSQALERALSKLDDVQLCDNTWQQAKSARQELIAIIQEFGQQANKLIEDEKRIAEDLRAEIAGASAMCECMAQSSSPGFEHARTCPLWRARTTSW